jgi:hypothetical protein
MFGLFTAGIIEFFQQFQPFMQPGFAHAGRAALNI